MSVGRKFKRVALGGTFDILHLGHERLLSRAFETGEVVLIGVVGDELSKKLPKKHPVFPYDDRVRTLKSYLAQHGWIQRAVIKRLDDRFGATISDPEIEGIIVTPETVETTSEINRIREAKGFKPLKVETVDLVLADDGFPISTTRIRRGEIDRQGRRVTSSGSIE